MKKLVLTLALVVIGIIASAQCKLHYHYVTASGDSTFPPKCLIRLKGVSIAPAIHKSKGRYYTNGIYADMVNQNADIKYMEFVFTSGTVLKYNSKSKLTKGSYLFSPKEDIQNKNFYTPIYQFKYNENGKEYQILMEEDSVFFMEFIYDIKANHGQ